MRCAFQAYTCDDNGFPCFLPSDRASGVGEAQGRHSQLGAAFAYSIIHPREGTWLQTRPARTAGVAAAKRQAEV